MLKFDTENGILKAGIASDHGTGVTLVGSSRSHQPPRDSEETCFAGRAEPENPNVINGSARAAAAPSLASVAFHAVDDSSRSRLKGDDVPGAFIRGAAPIF